MSALGGKRTFAKFGSLAQEGADWESEMIPLLLALAQAVSASPPERVDLTVPQPCASPKTENDEIVVCANPNGVSPYRLNPPAPRPRALPKAEVQVAKGVNVGAETESADVGGFTSNRAMLRLKIKF
jgi:hypothetical protein